MGTVVHLPGACTIARVQKRRPGPLPRIATDIRVARFDPRKRGDAIAPAEPTALERLERAREGLAIFEAEAERFRQKIRLLTPGMM